MSSLNVNWRGSRILCFGPNFVREGVCRLPDQMSPSAPVHSKLKKKSFL